MKKLARKEVFLRLMLLPALLVSGIGAAHAQQSASSEQQAQPSPARNKYAVYTIEWISEQFDQYGQSVITPTSITIKPSARPLSLLTERLQAVYGVPITYEDTKYVGGEVADIAIHPGNAPSKTVIAKTIKERIALYVNIEVPPDGAPLDIRKKLAAKPLEEAVHSYNSQRGDEVFTITESEKGFHVVARKFVDVSGKMAELKPFLDTPITLSEGTRSISEAVEEIAKALPGLGIGILPINLFLQKQTTISASNEPARSVLDRLLNGVPVPAEKPISPGRYRDTAEGGYLSWQLRTDPDPKWGSALNFEIVKPLGTL